MGLWSCAGKVVLAENESLSVWDVNSLEARRLHNINLVGKKLRALHVQNDDAECSGGVRQRYVLHDCKMCVRINFFSLLAKCRPTKTKGKVFYRSSS